MKNTRLPLVFINDVDINSLFSSLFTQSNLSSEVQTSSLYAFADPMLMFYQTIDGIVMSFGGDDCFSPCKSCLPFPRGALSILKYAPSISYSMCEDFNLFAVCDRFSYFDCTVMLVRENEKYSISANARRDRCYYFLGGGWYSYYIWVYLDSTFFVRGLYRWFARHNKKPQDYISEIEEVKFKLEEARQKNQYVYVKDRLVFDGLIIATSIYSGQTGNAVYWIVNGMCFNSLPSLKPSSAYISLIPKCGRGRVPLTKEYVSDLTKFAQRFSKLWCQLLRKIFTQLSDQYLVSTNASSNFFYSEQMSLTEFYIENVLAFVLYRRSLTLICV